MEKYKSKLKSELAQAAGVSLPTFRRWLLFTRMQFVAVTGKAKSGKTYLNSILMAAEYKTCIVCVLHQNKAAEDKTLRGALGTELQNKSFETYECKKDPETRIFSIQQTATRKYDMPNKIQFCVDKEGLPVGCTENSGLTSEAQDKEKQGGGFNGEYVGAVRGCSPPL